MNVAEIVSKLLSLSLSLSLSQCLSLTPHPVSFRSPSRPHSHTYTHTHTHTHTHKTTTTTSSSSTQTNTVFTRCTFYRIFYFGSRSPNLFPRRGPGASRKSLAVALIVRAGLAGYEPQTPVTCICCPACESLCTPGMHRVWACVGR